MNERNGEVEKNVALLIDADNAAPDSLDPVLTVLAELGTVNIRRAYGNWQKPGLKGWADINMRAKLLRRFADHARKGRHGVLLVCADLDPGGLRISGGLRKNLLDLAKAVRWEATEEALTIERFGLNADFVRRHRLTWIDNLKTGSDQDLSDADHEDHDKAYVQKYLAAYGPRKVEANALIVRPDAGRQLCRTAIERYVSKSDVDRYFDTLEVPRAAVQQALPGALRRLLREMRPR